MADRNGASLNHTLSGHQRRLPRARYLLLMTMALHFSVSIAILVASRSGHLSSYFDHNGISQSFASDTTRHYAEATELVRILKVEGIAAWQGAAYPGHTKLYSLSFFVFGPLFGYNVLAIEPLNLICYAAILFIVFQIGSELFDRAVGLISATIVALWPTFLLHTTQPLKDPMSIAALLGLVLLTSQWLMKSLTLPRALRTGVTAGALVLFLWLIRPDLRPLVLIVAVGAAVFQLARTAIHRQPAKWNLLAVSIMLVCVDFVPRVIGRYRNPKPHPLLLSTSNETRPGNATPPSPSSTGLTRVREQIAFARYLFLNYPNPGSSIDQEIRLASWSEVIRYLPRAAEIGFLAPFPSMWFGSGSQVGRAGRGIGGLETLFMYFVYALTLVALWKKRRFLPIWFLTGTAVISLVLMSLVVANVGALFRFRYPFWFLLIIVGVSGAMELLSGSRQSRRTPYKLVNELHPPTSEDRNILYSLSEAH